jgi:RNA polymerase sigma-70 factor (ECF subfamily)
MATSESVSELGAAVDSSDELSFDEVYRRHAGGVSRWIRRLWGERDAEDVLQEVFLVAQRRLPDFRGDAAIGTWLYGVTLRVVIAKRRKERLRRLLWLRAAGDATDTMTAVPSPQATLEQNEAANLVYSILDQLPERDRALLILFELEGLPAQAIADVLQMKVNAVWVALARSRAKFKRIFKERYPESQDGESHAPRW